MTPYYSADDIELWNADCRDVMAGMEDSSVDAIVTDPPYGRFKADAWDRQWSNDAEYLEWLGGLCAEWYRLLRPNGSLYVFASPKMSARVEVKIGETFNVLNRVTWWKDHRTGKGWHKQAEKEGLRQFFPASESIIFAEHYGADNIAKGEAGYVAACDELRGFVFEPLRAYLDDERKRAGVNFEQVRQGVGCANGSGLPSHWFTRSQWALPTAENYAKLRALFNQPNGTEYLRREYEDLRREYEDLRRPFNVSADVPYTDVWTFGTVQAYPGKHPCEKPLDLMRHIIQSSTRPGAVVLDPFMGSGSTGVACAQLGRDFIGAEISAEYAAQARQRIEAAEPIDDTRCRDTTRKVTKPKQAKQLALF